MTALANAVDALPSLFAERAAVEAALAQAIEGSEEHTTLLEALGELDDAIELARSLEEERVDTAADTKQQPQQEQQRPAELRPEKPILAQTNRSQVAEAGTKAGLQWCVPGALVMARWTDGKWYEARIQNVSPDSSSVTLMYPEYAETCEVKIAANVAPIESKEMLTAAATFSSSSRKRPAGEGRSSGSTVFKEREVPTSLKILPTDSDEVREQKRRKIKSIHTGNRFGRLDASQQARTAGWQQFAARTNKTKTSIFRTGDGVSARVGVVGSGRGVSQQREFDGRAVPHRGRR